MREVEASEFVLARPPAVHRALSPESVVAAEGTFDVVETETVDGDTAVVASAPGVTVRLRFRDRDDGIEYAADGAVGPFDHLETVVTVEPERNGSRLTMRSTVSLNLPLPFADRIAAWKRRGELRRAVDGLADSVA